MDIPDSYIQKLEFFTFITELAVASFLRVSQSEAGNVLLTTSRCHRCAAARWCAVRTQTIPDKISIIKGKV